MVTIPVRADMADVVKTMRLSKVAIELNIGLPTIFDFLDEKGVDIERSPNAKISTDLYEILLGEFQAEKELKEESRLLRLDKTDKETITMSDADKASPGKKESGEVVITDPNATPPEEKKPEAKKEAAPEKK